MTARMNKTNEISLEGMVVHSSKDYTKFRKLIGNRKPVEDNIKRLMASMSKKQLASIGIVNERFEVIDGQNRLEACSRLQIPFNFIIMKNYGIEEVHTLNTNMKNWTNEDYIRQFAQRFEHGESEFQDYFKLVEFIDHHDLKVNMALLLMEDGLKSGSLPLRDGLFTIKTTHEKMIENLLELKDLENELGYKITTQAFWQTYILTKRIEGFDSDKFLLKIKRCKQELEDCRDTPPLLATVFEEAYNTRNRGEQFSISFPVKTMLKRSKRDRDDD